MTNIEMGAMHSIVHLPRVIEDAVVQLKRIADVLEKMEAKDGPTIGQIVKDAIERGEQEKIDKEKNNERVL